MEKIESVKEYVELIQNSRNPTFTIVTESEYKLIDFEKSFFNMPLNKQKQIQISKLRKIIFYSNNKLDTYVNLDDEPINHEISVIEFNQIKNIECARIGVQADKIIDVTKLCRFLKPDNKDLILEYFKSVGKKLEKEKKLEKNKLFKENIDEKTKTIKDNQNLKKKKNPPKRVLIYHKIKYIILKFFWKNI